VRETAILPWVVSPFQVVSLLIDAVLMRKICGFIGTVVRVFRLLSLSLGALYTYADGDVAHGTRIKKKVRRLRHAPRR
jgi:hypothetical protein